MNRSTYKQYFRYILLLVFLGVLFCGQSGYAVAERSLADNLAGSVASLHLGISGYTIGETLSPAQKQIAMQNMVQDSYPGTYKFRDAELFVVVSQKDDTILALYTRNENAGFDQTRKMISGLMGIFGEPTTMAHDKIIYWAYGKQGKIPEETYNELREKGEKFDVLATVKFNSTVAITNEDPEKKQSGTIYFIISSDHLIQDFMGR